MTHRQGVSLYEARKFSLWLRDWANALKLAFLPADMTVGFIEGAKLATFLRGYVAYPVS